jgi:hypothetical protein
MRARRDKFFKRASMIWRLSYWLRMREFERWSRSPTQLSSARLNFKDVCSRPARPVPWLTRLFL